MEVRVVTEVRWCTILRSRAVLKHSIASLLHIDSVDVA